MSSVPTPAAWQEREFSFWGFLNLSSRAIGWGLAGGLVFAGAVLAYRRLSGAFLQPLAAPWLVAVGLLGWMWSFLARMAWEPTLFPGFSSATATVGRKKKNVGLSDHSEVRALAENRSLVLSRWIGGLSKGCFVLMAICLSVPGTSLAGLIGLWTIVVAGLAFEGWLQRGKIAGIPLGRRRFRGADAESFSGMDFREGAVGVPRCLPTHPEHWPEELLEYLVRIRTSSGIETRSGWVRVEFSPGQRTAVVHIAFCPPFVHKPVLHLHQAAGPEVRLKTTHLYPYGFRIEVKREPMDLGHSAWVLLGFEAKGATASEEHVPDPASDKPNG